MNQQIRTPRQPGESEEDFAKRDAAFVQEMNERRAGLQQGRDAVLARFGKGERVK